jgi:hypothetical protein
MVDVPVATLSGDPPSDATIDDLASGGDVCVLFGSTTPFTQETLVDLYGTADAYLSAFRTSADDAVAQGFLLQPDADTLIAESEENAALFP